jgi:hypothetical protein
MADELNGLKFGRWEVLHCDTSRSKQFGAKKINVIRYLCRCDCGTVASVHLTSLRQGTSKSCGCLFRERQTLRPMWIAMFRNCYNANEKKSQTYSVAGLTVCARWHDFEHFFTDVSPRPKNMILQLIAPHTEYSPINCEWTSKQFDNADRHRNITINGITRSRKEWAFAIGINLGTVNSRITRGMSIEEAFTRPLDLSRRRCEPK